ncbi:hemerythrin domain-containing protein [Dethiothermospora halolimnae]|uniref:hemerythrin domain-containing protein n=1 Tax=Dethiothermospora halolimnae TaxID=3114390 RepID=UPI003CCB922E
MSNVNTIDILVSEHNNIKTMLKVVRTMCLNILESQEVDYEDFYTVIDFIRNYADKYHHGKEEDMLFKYMEEQLTEKIGEGPIQGMLIEHDYGRAFVSNLELALKEYEKGNNEAKLDIIANAIGYGNLLQNHIHKEDNVIYRYAENNLSKETLNRLDVEFKSFEEDTEHIQLKEKYKDLINKLSNKYL